MPRRRIDDKQQIESEITAWDGQRNASGARIKWTFASNKARAKNGPRQPTARYPPRGPSQRFHNDCAIRY